MNKIAQKMLQHKKGIVALFAVLAVLCALLSRRVKVDYNMMHYLPKDAPSTIALDVMEEEYSAKTANCRSSQYHTNKKSTQSAHDYPHLKGNLCK